MRQRRHSRSVVVAIAAPIRSLALLLLALLLALAAWSAVGSWPAFASIYDPDASPSLQVVYTSSGPDYAGDLCVSAGVVYVAGSAFDGGPTQPSLLKVPLLGAPPSRATYPAIEGYQQAMVMAPGGSIFTTGRVRKSDGNMRLLLVKWTKAGQPSWIRRFSRSGSGSDGGVDIGVDRAGNVIIAGYVAAGASRDWIVVSWTPTGRQRWAWRYNGSGNANDDPAELYVDRDGNTYVTGMATLTGGATAALTVKLAPTGKKLWARTYRGPDGAGAKAGAIARRAAGGVWVGGTVKRATGGWDAMLVRYSASGKLVASTPIHSGSPTASTSLADIAAWKDDHVVGVGARSDGGLTDPFECAWDGSAAGAMTVPWSTYFGDGLLAVAADTVGGYCVTGQRAKGEDWRAVDTYRRSRSGGGMYWTYTWDGPTDRDAHRPVGIVTTATTVVVAGTCDSETTGDDQFVQVWRY